MTEKNKTTRELLLETIKLVLILIIMVILSIVILLDVS